MITDTCSSKINHYSEMCAQRCPLHVQTVFGTLKYTGICRSIALSNRKCDIGRFPSDSALAPHTPWKFAPIDPHPPGISSNFPWGRYRYFLEPHNTAFQMLKTQKTLPLRPVMRTPEWCPRDLPFCSARPVFNFCLVSGYASVSVSSFQPENNASACGSVANEARIVRYTFYRVIV